MSNTPNRMLPSPINSCGTNIGVVISSEVAIQVVQYLIVFVLILIYLPL